MIKTINLHDFRQAFQDYGRGEQFSYEALGLIFEYYEQYENDTGVPYELDVIALCCDIAEMTAEEVINDYCVDVDYCIDVKNDASPQEIHTDAINFLNYKTRVIGKTDDTIIFFQF